MKQLTTKTKKLWAAEIRAAWQKTVDGIFEVGDLLIAARAGLDHGEFLQMVMHELPFSPRTAQSLMAIARDPRLRKAHHGALLPPSWRTLDELTRLNDEQFAWALGEGVINPDMQRSEAVHASSVWPITDPARVAEFKRVEEYTARVRERLRGAFHLSDERSADSTTATDYETMINDADMGDWIARRLIETLSAVEAKHDEAALLCTLSLLKGEENTRLPQVLRAIDEFITKLRAALD
jgi:hypothetical protein